MYRGNRDVKSHPALIEFADMFVLEDNENIVRGSESIIPHIPKLINRKLVIVLSTNFLTYLSDNERERDEPNL